MKAEEEEEPSLIEEVEEEQLLEVEEQRDWGKEE